MYYPINEVFQTIQGEGWHTGVAALFVRLQGCDVGCPWCDTQQTWVQSEEKRVSADEVMQVDGKEGHWSLFLATDLLQKIQEQGWTARWVVITGGEPCMYDLRSLCETFEQAGYQVQVETSGTYPVMVTESTWVTVSPKVDMKGKRAIQYQALARANEIKHPIATQHHLDQLDALLDQLDEVKHVCLQPISQKPHATELAMRTCIERNWRLSVQMHKYLQID
tara:strand:+ start:3672 stop:4337 length:666 start_codon:yes stop_codon:yes gene_type:complete